MSTASTTPSHNWSSGRWVSHSIGCFEDTEWSVWAETARLTGKSTNGWIRDSLNQMAAFDRLNLEDGTIRKAAV